MRAQSTSSADAPPLTAVQFAWLRFVQSALDLRRTHKQVLGMALKYKPFAASKQLVNAAKSNPPVGKGAHGSGVYLIQGALIDLGFELPISTRKHHRPDGIYGKETSQVVLQYQTLRRLKKPDGIVGRETMEALDNDMSSGSHPIPLKPPVPKAAGAAPG